MRRACAAILWLLMGVVQCGAAQDAQDSRDSGASRVDAGTDALPLLVNVDLSASEITVGDRVEATLMVVWMGEATTQPARFPTWQETWGRAEVLEVGEVTEVSDASGRRIWKQALTLTAFRPGEIKLPPVTVVLPLPGRTVEATTGAASFTIGSVLPQPEEPQSETSQAETSQVEPEIPEPKGLASAMGLDAHQRNFWWTAGTLSALLMVCLVWTAGAVARQPAAAASEAEPVDPLRLLSPLDELRERLVRLDPAAGAEPLHTGLSFALRMYLSRRLHFRAVESTTSEIQRALRRAALSADANHRAIGLLRDADAVKFARADVSAQVAAWRLAEAAEVARQIEGETAPAPRLETQQSDTEAKAT